MSDEQVVAPSPEATESEPTADNAVQEVNSLLDNKTEGEAVKELQDEGMSKKEAKAEVKRLKQLKIKVDGKEFTEDLPFEIDDDPKTVEWMTKNLQMSKAAQRRMAEKAQIEKEVSNFIEELRKDPKKILSDPNLGVDVKKLAAAVIEEEIENSKKSPEQIQREKLEAELKQLKEEREKEAKTAKEKELERLQQQEYERYDMLMTQAIEKSDLPKSPYVVKKMADFLLMGLEEGLDITPEDVLPLVREEITNDIKEMFAVMPEDVIEALVGKEKINGLRKKNLAKAKAATKPSIKDVGAKKTEEKPKEKVDYKKFFGI